MQIYGRVLNLLISVIFITVLLSACQTSKNPKNSKVHLEENIISTDTDAGTNTLDVTIYEDSAYMVSQGSIVRYHLPSGERSVIAEADGNMAICADRDYLYTYNKVENAVIKYDRSGQVISTYPLSFKPFEADRMIINKDTLIIASLFVNAAGYSESELYQLNLSTGEGIKLSPGFKGKDSYSLILGLNFIDDQTIMISSYATVSILNMIVKGYRFDLKEEKVMEEYILQNVSNKVCSYDAEGACFYYIDNGKIKKYDTKSSLEIILSTLDTSSLDTDGNSGYASFFIKRLFYTGDNVILWDNVNNFFMIVDLSSDIEPVRILLSDMVGAHLDINPVIEQFEAEYGCAVQIIEYPEEVYKNKLRTKLLAADSDFDVFIIKDPTQDNFLDSIIRHGLYEPLDGYDGIVSNFSNMYSGVQSMMSHKGQFFGLPYYLQLYSTAAINDDLKQYGFTLPGKHWTMEQLWHLCDRMLQSGEHGSSVFGPSNIMIFINMFVQDAIDQNHFDKDALTALLENIKKYSDAGVLYDNANTRNHLLTYLYMYFDSFVTHSSIPDDTVYGTILLPEYRGHNYLYLLGCTFLNKASVNKEMAAKFLEVLTRKENIYNINIYRCTLLGSDLTQYNIYQDWSETELSYLSDLPYIYENAKVFSFDYLALNVYLNENLRAGFEDGSISAEEAADIIYERVNYTYFEKLG